MTREATDPAGQLLATFLAVESWVADGFEDCPFIVAMAEPDRKSPRRLMASTQLDAIRSFLELLADLAGLTDPAQFAMAWQMLLRGAVVGAFNGDADAIPAAGHAARLLLDGWGRR